MGHAIRVMIVSGLVMVGCGRAEDAAKPPKGPQVKPEPSRRAVRRAPPRRAVRVVPRERARRATAPDPACRRKGRVRRIDLHRLAGVSFWGRQGKVRRAVWRRRAPFLKDDGQVQKVKGGFLAAWIKDERGSMWRHPEVGEARRKGVGFVGRGRLRLARGWDGTAIVGTAVFDVDADGRPELLVRYRWESKPERAVGQHSVEYLAVVDLKGPRLQGLIELGRGGQASVHPKCTAVVRRGDLRCAGKPSLYVTRTCKVICPDRPGDPGCERTQWSTVEVRYDPAEDRYLPETVFGGPARVAPVKDDRPWLVIAASVPSGRWGARRVADKTRAALARRGFPAAAVHFSRAFAKLREGYWVVVVGRHATKKTASAQLARVKAKRFQGYVRQGF